jgi:zinc transport system permease protein
MVDSLMQLISVAPIQRAAIAFLLSGAVFPLVGVFVAVLDLVPLRFALMHGALLGGVIGLMLDLNSQWIALGVNILMVLILGPLSLRVKIGLSNVSAFMMVASIALAFLLIDISGLQAWDAFSVLWGNIYALTNLDLYVLMGLAGIIIGFIVFWHRAITAVLFDMDIAYTSGIASNRLYYFILILTGSVVAFSIKLIGALLLDSLLLLPAIAALYFARSMRQLYMLASGIGMVGSIIGFSLSMVASLQASPAVTLSVIFVIGVIWIINRFNKKKGQVK